MGESLKQRNGMLTTVVNTLAGLEALRPEWLDLWQRCPTATPFHSPQWLLPWTRYLFGGGQICCLTIREAGDLLGFAPLFRWGIDRQTISFLGAGISDYGDILFAPEREPECVSAVRSFLENEHADAVIDLQEIRPGSGLLNGIPEQWKAEECSVCPVLALSDFHACMDPKHRTDLRRAGNRISRESTMWFAAADRTSFPGYLKDFFRLHGERWGRIDDALRQFHCEASQNFLETGHLRLSVLNNGDAAIAAIYAFISGRTLWFYLSGYDARMSKFSPGAALILWMIEQAIAEGVTRVDFLRKGEGYKYLWGAVDRPNYAIRSRGA